MNWAAHSNVGVHSPILIFHYACLHYAEPQKQRSLIQNSELKTPNSNGVALIQNSKLKIRNSILFFRLARLALLFHQLEVFLAQHEAVAEVFLAHYLVGGKLLGAALEEDAPLEKEVCPVGD